jgi:hypothetical protein
MRLNTTIERTVFAATLIGLYFGWHNARFLGVLSALVCPTLWSLFVYSALAGLEWPDDDPEASARVVVPLLALAITVGLCAWAGWATAWIVTTIATVATPYLVRYYARAFRALAITQHARGEMTGPKFGAHAGQPWRL